jgi:hypothetical protein
MIVYFDLDRTLFQTGRSDELWDMIGALYPEIDAQTAYQDRSQYYRYVGDQYYHDMSAQLQALGLEPEQVYEQLQRSELADGRFEYEYCHELLTNLQTQADIRVLTFGADDYQRFKASLCPSLAGIPIITTTRLKAEVLEDSEQECWLVDDKPIGDELPGNVSFVQVSLEGAPVAPDTIWPVKHSLAEVDQFFSAIIED